jgi:glycosyltransferase involved in cell wall biosynthesis
MQERRRVLFAIGSLACGGSERQLLGILKNLDRTQFEPHLYLLNRTGDFLEDVPDDVSVTAFSDLPRSGYYFPGRIMRQQIAHLTNHLESLKPHAVYDRAFLLPLVTAPATKRACVPRVSTIVSDPHRALQFSVKRFRRFKRAILHRACQQATRVVAVSAGVRQAAIDYYGISENKVEMISNGFEFDEIEAQATDGKTEIARQEDAFHIVSVGRLQHEKDLETLISAVAQVSRQQPTRKLQVTLVGEGPSRSNLEQLATASGLDDVVQFVGYQSNPFAWMKAADLFCMTSKYEGMPNVLVEAIICGVPVISTDCPHGPHEILDGGRLGGLVPVGDSNALANSICDVMDNPNTAKQKAKSAKISIMERYSMPSSVKQLESLLLDL